MRKYIWILVFFFTLLSFNSHAYKALYYGPTMANEHLWRIAMEVRPMHASLQQTMLAILQSNPQAFKYGNINGLKAGYHLRIPTSMQIHRIPIDEAFALVKRQNFQWARANYTENNTYAHNTHRNKNNSYEKIHDHSPRVVEIAKHIPANTDQQSSIHVAKETSSNKLPSSSLSDLANQKNTSSLQHKNSQLVQDSSNVKIAGNIVAQNNKQIKANEQNSSPIAGTTTSTSISNLQSNNVSQVTQNQLDKINSFIQESTKFKETTNSRLNNLENQFQGVNDKLTKLGQEFSTLTYHFIQIVNTNTPNSWNVYFTQLQESLKKYGINLLLGFLTLLVLLAVFKKMQRRRRAAVKLATADPSPREKSANTKDEYDFIGSQEGIPTKLDLARAYIDMGDYKNAKDALDEVVEIGDIYQKKEARALLDKIPSSLS